MAKAYALFDGRLNVSFDDLKQIAGIGPGLEKKLKECTDMIESYKSNEDVLKEVGNKMGGWM